MKKCFSNKLLIPLFSSMLVMTACSKQEYPATQEAPDTIQPSSDVSKVAFEKWYGENKNRLDNVTWKEVIQFNDIKLQRTIFNAVPAKTKAAIWHEKYGDLLKNNDFNDDQIEYVKKSDAFITESLYSTPIMDNSDVHYQIQRFRKEGEKLFEHVQLHQIIASLSPTSKQIGGACSCSSKSDWCDIPSSIGQSCKGACDYETSFGCGTFFGYGCNGKCAF